MRHSSLRISSFNVAVSTPSTQGNVAIDAESPCWVAHATPEAAPPFRLSAGLIYPYAGIHAHMHIAIYIIISITLIITISLTFTSVVSVRSGSHTLIVSIYIHGISMDAYINK